MDGRRSVKPMVIRAGSIPASGMSVVVIGGSVAEMASDKQQSRNAKVVSNDNILVEYCAS